jgi:hypothetical protein
MVVLPSRPDPQLINLGLFLPSADSVAAVLAVKGALRRAQKPGAPLTASGPLRTPAPLGEEKQKQKTSSSPLADLSGFGFCIAALFSTKILRQDASATTIANSVDP